MIKNKVRSIRINDEIEKKLKSMGHTVQKLLDEKINELLNIEVKETVKITKK